MSDLFDLLCGTVQRFKGPDVLFFLLYRGKAEIVISRRQWFSEITGVSI